MTFESETDSQFNKVSSSVTVGCQKVQYKKGPNEEVHQAEMSTDRNGLFHDTSLFKRTHRATSIKVYGKKGEEKKIYST